MISDEFHVIPVRFQVVTVRFRLVPDWFFVLCLLFRVHSTLSHLLNIPVAI